MTPQQIDQFAQNRTEQIANAIKAFIQKGGHSDKGAVNFLVVGEKAGIKNLGKIIGRKGISMRTIFRVLVAIDAIASESNLDTSTLDGAIFDAFKV